METEESNLKAQWIQSTIKKLIFLKNIFLKKSEFLEFLDV